MRRTRGGARGRAKDWWLSTLRITSTALISVNQSGNPAINPSAECDLSTSIAFAVPATPVNWCVTNCEGEGRGEGGTEGEGRVRVIVQVGVRVRVRASARVRVRVRVSARVNARVNARVSESVSMVIWMWVWLGTGLRTCVRTRECVDRYMHAACVHVRCPCARVYVLLSHMRVRACVCMRACACVCVCVYYCRTLEDALLTLLLTLVASAVVRPSSELLCMYMCVCA